MQNRSPNMLVTHPNTGIARIQYYGFNGMEKDDEVKGKGNSVNYTYRMHDPRLGRFFAVDPLTRTYPMLTPYQFCSNSPIYLVEMEGLEGISYRVIKKDEVSGEVTVLKRVIEVNIYLAVNELGTRGAYSSESAEELKVLMTTKYNENGYIDDEGLVVEFKINFKDFNPKDDEPNNLATSLNTNRISTNYSLEDIDLEGNVTSTPYRSKMDVVMWKQKISAAGVQKANTIKINPMRGIYKFGHAECHELTHFFLLSVGITQQTPNVIDDHSLGGWMQYGTAIKEDGVVIDVQGVDFNFSKDSFEQILRAVPRVDDKIQE